MALLTRAGHRAYFVGGCVRNALIGAAATDIDIATDARPERVLDLAGSAGIRTVPSGIEHGTVTLVLRGAPFEVTTFRRDVETFGRHAVVAFSDSLAEDAARRDFTMNALYADGSGAVLDPLGEGLADLAARRLRFVGDPQERIAEDYLRVLRFFRFHAWYADPEGGLDPEGLAACAAGQEGLDALSRERVGAETRKLLAAPDPATALGAMAGTGILARILPGADPRAIGPLLLAERKLGVGPDWPRRLAALGGAPDWADRLRLSKAEARRIAAIGAALGRANPAEAAYRHGAEAARDAALIRVATLAAVPDPGLAGEIARGAAAKMPVSAADLPLRGPALGAALRALEGAWIDSGFTLTRADLLRHPAAQGA
ncbi:CCA tRNA nucleotidyltransferase [Amaricoccus solimangrovi]|uniref:CCA tRNA nucleotidyltransferase n=1 Tax=Amaricoccus solimangrovi TaxID=2589815 RepID=A0A501WS39_9RHOB|nr:CCA tRNA nucleotidyltransferase [Amaricoccus solimangrovi]TPE52269.1 CCA tRNA nucleotidyltransferase [Amaricoccus solimangrovi]